MKVHAVAAKEAKSWFVLTQLVRELLACDGDAYARAHSYATGEAGSNRHAVDEVMNPITYDDHPCHGRHFVRPAVAVLVLGSRFL